MRLCTDSMVLTTITSGASGAASTSVAVAGGFSTRAVTMTDALGRVTYDAAGTARRSAGPTRSPAEGSTPAKAFEARLVQWMPRMAASLCRDWEPRTSLLLSGGRLARRARSGEWGEVTGSATPRAGAQSVIKFGDSVNNPWAQEERAARDPEGSFGQPSPSPDARFRRCCPLLRPSRWVRSPRREHDRADAPATTRCGAGSAARRSRTCLQSRLRAAAQFAIGVCLLLANETWAQAGPSLPRPGDPLQRALQAPQLPRTLPAPAPPPAAAPQIVIETPALILNSVKRFTAVHIEVPALILNSSKTTPRR